MGQEFGQSFGQSLGQGGNIPPAAGPASGDGFLVEGGGPTDFILLETEDYLLMETYTDSAPVGWWVADDLEGEDGSRIETWPDTRGGSYPSLVKNDTNGPLLDTNPTGNNGHQAVGDNGGSPAGLKATGLSFGPNYTILMAWRSIATAGVPLGIGGNTSSEFYDYFYFEDDLWFLYRGNCSDTSDNAVTMADLDHVQKFNLFKYSVNEGSGALYINDVPSAVVIHSLTGCVFDTIRIFGSADGASLPFFIVSEIVLFDGIPNNATLRYYENRLRIRYDLPEI